MEDRWWVFPFDICQRFGVREGILESITYFTRAAAAAAVLLPTFIVFIFRLYCVKWLGDRQDMSRINDV